MILKTATFRAALLTTVCAFAFPSYAQSGITQNEPIMSGIDEVVVTARRRDETAISAPVSITAFSGQQLDNLAVNSFADLSTIVPNLTVGEISSGIGGSIHLRGVGTNAGQNASFEQTVSINIDGVQISRGAALRLGQFDMERIEVLRGPQALFFGKNSPAGVISIASATPTAEFDAMVRASYEFNGREPGLEAFVSGPLTDTLRVRVAGRWSDMGGYFKNLAAGVEDAANAIVPGVAYSPISRGPKSESWIGRVSADWTPSDTIDTSLRITWAQSKGPGFQQGPNQRIACPYGAPQLTTQVNAATPDPALRAALLEAITLPDCRADGSYAYSSIPPSQLVNSPLGKDPRGEAYTDMIIASLQANWTATDTLTLTSVTGYAETSDRRYDTYSYAPIATIIGLNFGGETNYRQISQEFRLLSNFEGRFNFLTGAYFEDSKFDTFIQQFSTPGPRFDQIIDGKTYSVFAQAMFDLTDTVELSGGLRWSREERHLSINRDDIRQPVSPEKARFNNTSPEITLSWRPTADLTVYGGFRAGFKSGGFATPLTGGAPFVAPGPDYRFEPEKVDGFEVGFHTSVFDRQLRMNFAAYDYAYKNLQVSSNDTSGPLPVLRTSNAAAATVRGAEFDFTYRPASLSGVTVRGALNYADNSFDEFEAICYIGQTVAEGCALNPSAGTGRFTAQDLSGKQMPSASKWTGSLGLAYDGELDGSDLGYGFGTDLLFRSKYNPHPELDPLALQKGVTFINASARLHNHTQGWELALIGRNLTQRYRATQAGQATLTGNGALTGSTVSGGHADIAGFVNRGREIMLRLTIHPGRWMN